MIECNEIVIMDHQGYIIDININEYFRTKPINQMKLTIASWTLQENHIEKDLWKELNS